uniref:Cytochrome c oxidase subunit 3 n=1 Tax=Rhabditophanes sp. KR3021 TaxID=114890 RepID=A0AC35UHD8_9BILA
IEGLSGYHNFFVIDGFKFGTVLFIFRELLSNKNCTLRIVITIVLAAIFTAVQGIEYAQARFSIADGVFGRIFYLATGFHGVHVLFGGLFLFFNLIRLVKNHFTFNHHLGLEFAILY